MAKDKFLTVFAVFDNQTQLKLKALQEIIIENAKSKGTQSRDIPFHITLGSFPTSQEKELTERIERVCSLTKCFDIDLTHVNFFGSRVVFIEPSVNESLIKLHNEFDNNYANGFDWHAHATLFIDERQEVVDKIKPIAIQCFKPMKSRIVGVQMGEFFPTRMITEKDLLK